MQVATISADLQVGRESYMPGAQCHARVLAYLYEYGITLRRGRKSLRETMAIVLDDLDTRLPTCLKNTLKLLWERYQLTVEQLTEAEKYKAHLVNQLEP